MGYYWSKCPYCGSRIEAGYSKPKKRLGKPERLCIRCGKVYLDSNIVDWDNVSFLDKILYFFANGRFFFCLFPIMFTGVFSWIAGVVSAVLIWGACILVVKVQVQAYREGNNHRRRR